SDGASAELRARATALPPEAGLDPDTRWASIGLAIRAGHDYAPLLPSVEEGPAEYNDHVRRFIEIVRAGRSLTSAEQALNGVPPSLRGQAYCVGIVVLGDKAPSSWRLGAIRLLFASERPYFHGP